MNSLHLFLLGTGLCVLSMTLLWLLGRRSHNYSFVDLGWSAHFALLAVLYALLTTGWPERRILIAAMYGIWSLRLALHLAHRIIGEPEEGRYVQLREEWAAKGNVDLRFYGFFQLQAGLNVFLALPLLISCQNPAVGWHWLELLGAVLWVIAILGESIADGQLRRFKANAANKGQVCNTGLWRYSRHPNYFFEWTIWVAYAVFGLASPGGYWSVLMPALMLHFLLNVTGIKATEEQALKSRGDAYREYQRTTSAFIPWFVKK